MTLRNNLQLQVKWDPYTDLRDKFPLKDVTYFYGCIRMMDVVEPYHPDRVLRQFGYVQTIPRYPLVADIVERGETAQKYRIFWAALGDLFDIRDSFVLSTQRRGRRAEPAWESSDDYLEWYQRLCHPFVQNPERRSVYASSSTRPEIMMTWDRIVQARNMIDPLIQRWDEDQEFLSVAGMMPVIRDISDVLHGRSSDAGPSGGDYS